MTSILFEQILLFISFEIKSNTVKSKHISANN